MLIFWTSDKSALCGQFNSNNHFKATPAPLEGKWTKRKRNKFIKKICWELKEKRPGIWNIWAIWTQGSKLEAQIFEWTGFDQNTKKLLNRNKTYKCSYKIAALVETGSTKHKAKIWSSEYCETIIRGKHHTIVVEWTFEN